MIASEYTYSVIVSLPSVFVIRLIVSPGCAGLDISSRNVFGRSHFPFINCICFVIAPAIAIPQKLNQ